MLLRTSMGGWSKYKLPSGRKRVGLPNYHVRDQQWGFMSMLWEARSGPLDGMSIWIVSVHVTLLRLYS